MTNNSHRPVRLPAEWEPQGAVLIAWPHNGTDWAYMLPEVEKCYIEMTGAISRHATVIIAAPDTSRARMLLDGKTGPNPVLFFDTPTNDTWTRDYGVITTIDSKGHPVLNDFGFNAWGGKFESALDNGVTGRMVTAGLLRGKYIDHNNFILEGGSIESDGQGTLMVTDECLLTPTRNPSMSRADIEAYLKKSLGVDHILWIAHGGIIGDDTDGHIDTLARFAPDDVIVVAGRHTDPDIDDPDQQHMLEEMLADVKALRTADGRPYTIIELPMPDPIYDEDGSRLPATYANYLILNNTIIMPTYGQPRNDALAAGMMLIAYPGYEIERVDCRALIRQHGSLHCATMQLPHQVLPI
ncbi:MAG: agmatine deiminase family protein [Bacteroidales bacterium]|nr:agmatine deiminase family protein [Bacteroidales bacterium]